MSSLKQPQQAIRRSCLVFHMQTYLTIATPFKLNKESNQASEMTFDFQAPCQSLWLFVKACPIEERLCSSPFLVNYNIYIYILYSIWKMTTALWFDSRDCVFTQFSKWRWCFSKHQSTSWKCFQNGLNSSWQSWVIQVPWMVQQLFKKDH